MIGGARSGVPGWRIGWLAAAVLWFSVAGLRAQSTGRLGSVEPPRRFELSAGTDLFVDNDDYGAGNVVTALVAVRWQADDPIGYRLWASWSRRQGSRYGSPPGDFLVAGVSSDLPIPLGRNVTLAPSVGVGYAAVLSGSGQYGESEEWLAILAGVAFRYKRLVVENHLLVLGGDLYKPLTVGLRF